MAKSKPKPSDQEQLVLAACALLACTVQTLRGSHPTVKRDFRKGLKEARYMLRESGRDVLLASEILANVDAFLKAMPDEI